MNLLSFWDNRLDNFLLDNYTFIPWNISSFRYMIHTLQWLIINIITHYNSLSNRCMFCLLIFITKNVLSFSALLVDVVCCIDHLHQRLKTSRSFVLLRTITACSLSASVVTKRCYLSIFRMLISFFKSLDSISIAQSIECVLAWRWSRSNIGNHDCSTVTCEWVLKYHS